VPDLDLSPVRPVVPGRGLPSGIDVDRSNNNLDVIDHERRRWFAWRTAPTHFASADARLEVVSSDDLGRTWRPETTIRLGRDVREPRFFVFDGRLQLFAFEAGTDPKRFQPGRGLVVELGPDGWTEPQFITEPGTVVWRVRSIGGRPVMSVYLGAETLYTAHPEPLRVELWTSDDCRAWRPLDPERQLLHIGTETELVETADGRVVYVCRKEGPDGGWGTDVGVASVDDPLEVRWRSLPQKCDSPLLVTHERGVRLVTRKQVRAGGRFDLGWRRGSPMLRTRAYQLTYSFSRKRTAVYSVDLDDLSLRHLGDLPSRGDTAFAAVVGAEGEDPFGAKRWTVYNYTSPLDGPDVPWFAGQLRPTHIVAVDIDPTGGA
jgi:hypothetical protein